MKKLFALVPLIAFGVCTAYPQTTEERLDALEKKMDSILELLKTRDGGTENKRQPANPEKTPAKNDPKIGVKANEKPAEPTGKETAQWKQGALLSAYEVTTKTYSVPATENPIVIDFPDRSDAFNAEHYLLSPDGKRAARNYMGVKWTGYLKIDAEGVYEFSAKSVGDSRGSGQLAIEDQAVVATKSAVTSFGSFTLKTPGRYKVEVWAAASRSLPKDTVIEIAYRKRGDQTFKLINPSVLHTPVETPK